LVALPAAIVIIVGASLGTFFLISHQNSAEGLPGPAGGTAFFYSSGQINPSNSQGIEDGIQVTLKNISSPATGKSYYAWLLSDIPTSTTTPVSTPVSTPTGKAGGSTTCPTGASTLSTAHPLYLGRVAPDNGTVNFHYVDPLHNNLLQLYSRFLITEENANTTPVSPSPDQHAWRYYAQFPQTIEHVGQCFSALDYIRHLLVEGRLLHNLGLHGGLDVQIVLHTLKILEWAGSAKDDADANLQHRQVIRILDYLDGAVVVKHDAPGEPLLVDKTLAQVPLLNPLKLQTAGSSSYLERTDFQLIGLISAPGATPQLHGQARSTEAALANLQSWLEQVRTDAIKLERSFQQFGAQWIQQPQTPNLLAGMQTYANYAVVGRLDPNANQVQPGAIEIHYSIQQFATLNVVPFTMKVG